MGVCVPPDTDRKGSFRFFNLVGNFIVFSLVIVVFFVSFLLFTIVVAVRAKKAISNPARFEEPNVVASGKEKFRYAYTSEITVVGRTNDAVEHVYNITMMFGFTPKNKEVENEINWRKLELQDLLRSFFGLRSARDLRSLNEKELKMQLLKKMGSFLKRSGVDEVLFLRFDVI